ncbi:MAG: dihydrolipoyl dehydrogenase, partial [Clostridia bacterium]|nr:dihydrolipoyl dehydrogenase [Clostridia bacterium]
DAASALGGTCLHRGCVPTKAYLHAASLYHEAENGQSLGLQGQLTFDRAQMLRYKDGIVDQLCAGLSQLMKANRIDVYEGNGTLWGATSPFCVQVGETALTAKHVILATGSMPARLPVPGCDDPEVWTSDDLLSSKGAEPFESLCIIGGGVIGVEMASIYAKLGVCVTLIEAEKNCLPMLDRELSRAAETLLKELGCTLYTGARLEKIERAESGFTITSDKAALTARRVLLATGRRPVLDGAVSEAVNLLHNGRFLAADAHYETSVPGVYAIGDVNGEMQLAHAAHAQGVCAVSHILGVESPILPKLAPSCVYTSPEIASVGLTQDEAKASGRDVVCVKALTSGNARTLIEGLGRGFIKLVLEKQTKVLLGAQLFCGRATDLIGELALGVARGMTAQEMLLPMRAHPTFYEAVTDALEAAIKK